MVNSLRATMRAIWHNQSFERVAQASWKWAPRHNERNPTHTKWREGCASKYYIYRCSQIKHCAHHEELWTVNIEKVKKHQKTTFYPGLSHFLAQVYKVLHLRKMSPRHPKCCGCHTESSSCYKSNSTKRDLRPFQHVVQVNQILLLPRKIASESTSHFDPCLPTF